MKDIPEAWQADMEKASDNSVLWFQRMMDLDREHAELFRWMCDNLADVQRNLDDRLRVVTANDRGPWCETYEAAVRAAMEQDQKYVDGR